MRKHTYGLYSRINESESGGASIATPTMEQKRRRDKAPPSGVASQFFNRTHRGSTWRSNPLRGEKIGKMTCVETRNETRPVRLRPPTPLYTRPCLPPSPGSLPHPLPAVARSAAPGPPSNCSCRFMYLPRAATENIYTSIYSSRRRWSL
jgi:hypothetical protein